MTREELSLCLRIVTAALGFICMCFLAAIGWWLQQLHEDVQEMKPKVERAVVWIELTAREEVEGDD